jgi:hypothetical protein
VADTGKIATEGYSAGAIKYVVLEGFVPNPSAIVNANLITMGFGAATAFDLVLDGLVANPAVGSGAFYIFGDTVIQ